MEGQKLVVGKFCDDDRRIGVFDPSAGDFDGDGKTDVAVFNAGSWTIKKSSNNQTITVSFGSAGDKPVASGLRRRRFGGCFHLSPFDFNLVDSLQRDGDLFIDGFRLCG